MIPTVRVLLGAASFALIAACADDDRTASTTADNLATSATAPALTGAAAVQATIDEIVTEYPTLHGVVVHVVAPGVDETFVAGENAGAPVSADATFRLASNTKTFTAAAALRLVEQGKVDIDGPITQCLDDQLIQALASDGYQPDAITVRQALTHTAGLFDYAQGEGSGYVDAVLADPMHRWTPLEQVQWAVDHGDPLGAPGAAFSYSDTGYVIASSLIECASGLPMADAYRELLGFDELGVEATYLESLEEIPAGAGPRTHQFLEDVDTYSFDPSMDLYGAGGLVSNAADLAHFARALLRGEVFDQPTTLDTMLEEPDSAPPGAAMGLFREEIYGTTCWSHQGFWGTGVFTCPDVDLTISASVQQAALDEVDLNAILDAAFTLVPSD
jgi:D-alanyl-D-alanine carboxypeptidase